MAFILPKNGWAPWSYWNAHTSRLRPIFDDADVAITRFRSPTTQDLGEIERVKANMVQLGSQIITLGADAKAISHWSAGDIGAMIPPYSSDSCRNSPVLEVGNGVRLVSRLSSPGTTSTGAGRLASRTIVVAIRLPEGS
jgi:hypothetical protein